MNMDECEEFFKVKEAFRAGKKCQYWDGRTKNGWNDFPEGKGIEFDWHEAFEAGQGVRLKPQSITRPWTHDEAPIGGILKHKISGSLSVIIGVDKRVNNFVHAYEKWLFPADLLENNLVSTDNCKTWLPCGTTIEQ